MKQTYSGGEQLYELEEINHRNYKKECLLKKNIKIEDEEDKNGVFNSES